MVRLSRSHSIRTNNATRDGHEIGILGSVYEVNSVLAYENERDLMLRSADNHLASAIALRT